MDSKWKWVGVGEREREERKKAHGKAKPARKGVAVFASRFGGLID